MTANIFYEFSDILVDYEIELSVTRTTPSDEIDYGSGGTIGGSEESFTTLGAPTTLSNEDKRFDENGTYTFQDKKVYIRTDEPQLQKDDVVTYDGLEYKVLDRRPYQEYADVNIYFIKRLGDETW